MKESVKKKSERFKVAYSDPINKIQFNTPWVMSIYNVETHAWVKHPTLCLAVFIKPGKQFFSLITQHNNTNQIQPSLHPAGTDNTEII